jgi:DNA-binding protein WhiA
VAAAAATARVRRALEILGEEIPHHLLAAAQLRLQHEHDSLDKLGQRADPPMTKDAIAGRLRRLLITADTLAHSLGIPGTESALIGDPDLPDRHTRP